MSKPLSIVAVVVLLCGLAIWFARDGVVAPPSPERAPAPPPAAAPDATPGAASQPSPVDAAVDGDRVAVAPSAAAPPIPADASWVDVLVVDAGAPVPEAAVSWSNEDVVAARIADGTLAEDDTLRQDPEALAAAFGWRTSTDARGIARIHRGPRTTVTARRGERFGVLRIDGSVTAPPGGFRLELESDRGFDVQVLDAGGGPAVGVAVAIAATDDRHRSSLLGFAPRATTRAPDGIARIRHVQLLRGSSARNDVRVRTYLPGFDDPGHPLDLAALPRALVVLHLPPTGGLRARVDLGATLVPPGVFELGENLPTLPVVRPERAQRADADGWAHFAHVPLGKKFVVRTKALGGTLTQVVAGPFAAGVEVAVSLAPAADRAILSGRLLDADRVPLADVPFRLRVRGQLREDARLATDAEGRFVAILAAPGDGDASTVTLSVQRAGEHPMLARAAPRRLRAGREDLGDLVLAVEPLVVAGSCTIDGVPAALPSVVAVQQLESETGEPVWRRCGELRLWLGADGAFALHGEVGPGRLRLVVGKGDLLPLAPIECAPGAAGVQVDLARGCDLAATLIVPEGAETQILATLVPRDPGGAKTRPQARPQAQADRRGDHHDLRWHGVPAGTYDLELSLAAAPAPLRRVEGITLPGPAPGDPRLAAIDLSDVVCLQTIRVLDAEGVPLRQPQGGVFVEDLGLDHGRPLVGFGFKGADATFLLPRSVQTVTVAVQGYRPASVACAARAVEVQLRPWPRATLSFVELDLPADVRVCARVEPPDATAADRTYRAGWTRGLVADLDRAPSQWVTVAGGQVQLMVDDVPRPVRFEVRGQRGAHTIDAPPLTVDRTTATLRVELPGPALRRAIVACERDG
ncbi:MAG: hypothetical protein R3F56_02575 [Planctomycetota bacterium]